MSDQLTTAKKKGDHMTPGRVTPATVTGPIPVAPGVNPVAIPRRIHALLRQHVGRDRIITGPEITKALGLRPGAERQVRRLIGAMKGSWSDIIVCSVPGSGFYVATDLEDIRAHRDWLAKQLCATKATLDEFDRIALSHGFRLNDSDASVESNLASGDIIFGDGTI